MQARLLFHVGQVMRSLSSIIKNYRTLQGNIISIGKEQSYLQVETNSSSTAIAVEEPVEQIDLAFLEEEAKKEAMKIVQDAELKAKAILEKAQVEIATMKQNIEAETTAYRTQINEEIHMKQLQAQEEVDSLIKAAYLEKENIIKQAEPEIVELVAALVHKIVDFKLISGIEWLTLFVKQAIEKEQFKEKVQVIVASKMLEENEEALQEAFKHLPVEVELTCDSRLSCTSCKVESSKGGITYDIKEGLQKMLDELQLLCIKG